MVSIRLVERRTSPIFQKRAVERGTSPVFQKRVVERGTSPIINGNILRAIESTNINFLFLKFNVIKSSSREREKMFYHHFITDKSEFMLNN
jgi:hypothetical protein